MGLQVYRKKRKFDVTSEPRGGAAPRKGHRFVIQKHDARRLHYDLRLELDGVMKSWAVTRGPSLVPGERRLAIHVEDHPIEYNDFEGTIPEGQYGGGTVLIWDRGQWHPEGDPHYGYKKGHLNFTLDGAKLHGAWHLVRMHGRPGDKKEPWLLIKATDDAARGTRDPDILEQEPQSVVTGRTIPEIAQGKGRARVWNSNRTVKENLKAGATRGRTTTTRKRGVAARTRQDPEAKPGSAKAKTKTKAKRAKESDRGGAPLPDFVPPSLATLGAQAPAGAAWLHEVKFDGYRTQARLDHGKVRLLTRKGLDWTSRFPNVAAAVTQLRASTALIDGEIVVEDERGISSFSDLQAALKDGSEDRFVYDVFDLLHLDGHDLRGAPLIERKAALARLLRGAPDSGPIRYSEHFEDDGPLVLRHACEMSLEGIVSKLRDAPYRSGRSDAFIKSKCANAQEFVIGGYVPSTVMPRAIGALVAGYYEDGKFIYAGRIGTGYSHATAKELWKRLHPLDIARPAFDRIPEVERRRRDVRWVKPEVVMETQFRGWTADRLLRQAAFKGIREDKPAREVVREAPAAVDGRAPKSQDQPAKVAAERAKSMTRTSAAGVKRRPARTKSNAPAERPTKPARAPAKTAARPTRPAAAKPRNDSDVHFTHPERVYWADVGITKQDLADYYRAAWDLMAPQVIGRPLSFLRCPDGTKGECFFQKHASAGLDDRNLRTVIDSKKRQVIAIDGIAGLLSLVQAGVLEVHVRGSMIDRLDICDRIVFDLDPGEGVGWPDIVAAARDVRARLAALDLESFVKLSGGKGLHVVLPIKGSGWDETKTFVQVFAQAMEADDPERYVSKMTKAIRPGKIFIDYLRNSLEQTSVAAYSTRARAGAPVSVPVSWQELGRTTAGNQYTVPNLGKRLAGLRQDPWRDIARVKQALPTLQTLRKRG